MAGGPSASPLLAQSQPIHLLLTPARLAAPFGPCYPSKMLSYQHAFHAGNLADVHKHSLLACTLNYLTQKDKPLTYIETHAGRRPAPCTAPTPTPAAP